MKKVYPGRGPSAMGVMSSIFAVVFGIFFVFSSMKMGAPAMFQLFGLGFVIMAIVTALYHYRNAFSDERMSMMDIEDNVREVKLSDKREFCPYCGKKMDGDYPYCPYCGRELSAQ